jgi:hypothetical protein
MNIKKKFPIAMRFFYSKSYSSGNRELKNIELLSSDTFFIPPEGSFWKRGVKIDPQIFNKYDCYWESIMTNDEPVVEIITYDELNLIIRRHEKKMVELDDNLSYCLFVNPAIILDEVLED